MQTPSLVDKILYALASLAARFYSEATREWAEKTVEELEGAAVKQVAPEEVEEEANAPSHGAKTYMFPPEKEEIKLLAGDQRERGLTAIVLAMKYRLKQYWVILLIPIVLYLITVDRGQIISLRNLGIYFDLFGAIIVVRSLYRTPTEIDHQSKSFIPTSPVGDPEDKLVVAVETVDSMFGSTLLATGFALQLLSASSALFTSAILLMVLIAWLGMK